MNIKKWLLNIGFVFALEVILQIAIFEALSIQIIYIFLFSVVTGSIINFLSNSTKNKVINMVLSILLNALVTIIFVAQYVHYKFYNSIFSFYSLINGAQVMDFFESILKVIKNNILFVILFVVVFIIYIVLNCFIKYKPIKKKLTLVELVLTVVLFVISIFSLKIDNSGIYSSYNLYHNVHVPTFMCNRLGLITTMRVDLQRTIFGFTEHVINVEDAFYSNKNDSKNMEYNTLDIDFDKLIEKENDKRVKELHSYFKDSKGTNKNEYTGLFKGKNFISITAESFSPIAIDKDLTPTLYKLYNESIHFNNFYTPIYYVSTSDGEYSTALSLLPKEGVWSMEKSRKNNLPFTYAHLFSKLGYSAQAYHNGKSKFYKRNLSHPNMGYKFTACGNGLEKKINCKIWPESDNEMIGSTISDYINDEHFMTYYLTVSGHLNYTFYGNAMAFRNKKAVKDLKYSQSIKAYLATNIELDKALNTLINELEKAGKLDDTVIAINADHYPYGLSTREMKERADYIKDEKFDIHKSNLIIWNNAMKKNIVVDKYASNLDILPTMLNLFGIEYDSRLLMGNDIFSNAGGLVIFNDRSWITEYGKYDAITKKYTPFKSVDHEGKYIDLINQIVYNKYSVSRSILETDYYKYLDLK